MIIPEPGILEVYDVQGRLVYNTERLNAGIYIIDDKILPAGLYFYSITIRDKKIIGGKITIIE
ncbi:MAG: T9SS type A sorting domain-containing protein [candidate division WOR-3 bacterium]